MKALLSAAALGLMLLGGASHAQEPVEDISPARHPNLAAAQKLLRQANERLETAQRANDWDMHGHAEKARQLLEQASHELKLAAEDANRKGR